MTEKKHDKVKLTAYLSEALLWKMREFGVKRRLNGDSDMIAAAIDCWIGAQPEVKKEVKEVEHEETAQPIQRRRAQR